MAGKISAFILVTFALAGAAQAGLTLSVVQDTTTPPTTAGLTAWNVYAVGTGGSLFAAADGNFFGPLQQVWKLDGDTGFFDTPTATAQSMTVASGKYTNDSEFRPDPNFVLSWWRGPTENNSAGTSTTSGNGVGTYLDGSFTLTSTYDSANFLLARIVLANGQTASFTGVVGDQNATLYNFSNFQIPEPTTLALLCAGALALRRRRVR